MWSRLGFQIILPIFISLPLSSFVCLPLSLTHTRTRLSTRSTIHGYWFNLARTYTPHRTFLRLYTFTQHTITSHARVLQQLGFSTRFSFCIVLTLIFLVCVWTGFALSSFSHCMLLLVPLFFTYNLQIYLTGLFTTFTLKHRSSLSRTRLLSPSYASFLKAATVTRERKYESASAREQWTFERKKGCICNTLWFRCSSLYVYICHRVNVSSIVCLLLYSFPEYFPRNGHVAMNTEN